MKNKKKDFVRAIALATVVLILFTILVMFTGCGNQAVFDTVWTFEKAVIFLPDGEKIADRTCAGACAPVGW